MKRFAPLLLVLALQAGPGHAAGGLDRSEFDPKVRPQDDLFLAVNGPWLSSHAIPPDKTGVGIGYDMDDRASERVRKICEDLGAAQSAAGSIEQKIGAYYRSYLDEAAIDRIGLAPLAPWFAQIDAVKTTEQLAALWGRWSGIANAPMEVQVGADPKESTINRVGVVQSGLGLPDRDYYLKKGDHFEKGRAAYLVYLETLFKLNGDAQAAAHAKTVYALEKQLATVQWNQVDSRDALKTYNPKTMPELVRLSPGIAWDAFFAGGTIAKIDRLTVAQPSYLQHLSRIVRATPVATWKLYQQVRLLDAQADVLPKAFRDASYVYHFKSLRGQEQPRPRWKLATAAIDTALGEAVGQIYVARHFPPENKARVKQMVDNLLAAFGPSIDALTWMSPATKVKAKEKLSKYIVKVGYPDKWRDYARLTITDGDALGNDLRAGRFEFERRAALVGKPVDRTEWWMTPQTVNAYYDPSTNEIAFPAAILDLPTFDMAADDAFNYGATAATIGHEISHGFDDFGSQYDGDGQLRNWWTKSDRKAFDALGTRLAKQFDAYQAVPGHHVNGRLTLGENIADLSGLEVALRAYHATLGGKPAPVIDGMTGEQRFFLAYALTWREKVRDERILQLVTTDPHAPARFRANGPVMNMDSFHDAFSTKVGDGMYKTPQTRIRIW